MYQRAYERFLRIADKNKNGVLELSEKLEAWKRMRINVVDDVANAIHSLTRKYASPDEIFPQPSFDNVLAWRIYQALGILEFILH